MGLLAGAAQPQTITTVAGGTEGDGGQATGASFREITSAHHKKCIKEHPDRSSLPDAGERFKAIQESYELLKDPEL